MSPKLNDQRGIGLPAAIFVITLMSAIAVAVNLLVTQNARTLEEELRLTRAFYAAESGAGFAMGLLFPPEDFPDYSTAAACPDVDRTYVFAVPGLTQCEVEISCEIDATVDGLDYFTVFSTGTCGEVSRTIQVRTSY
jgi:MSHA biogenesis protein MshP